MPRRSSDDDWIFDPSLAAINRELQREIREEAEEVESIVAQSELRGRVFADVAAEARNRGDFVIVATSRRTFTGQITAAQGDYVSLLSESYEADINLVDVAYLKVLRPGRQGGRARGELPGTFEMRLIERRSPVDRVEVGWKALQETVIGRITTIGQDHVVVLDDAREEWIIPIAAIAYVIRRRRSR